jgi:hypothetical protein
MVSNNIVITQETLLDKLGELAGEWRATKSDTAASQYQAVLRTLLMLGWRGELDVDMELPDRLMPEEYLNQFN